MSAAFAADDAEARGDAEGALGILTANLLGPDGKPFWRPWRVERLVQLVAFGPVLPRWVTSRWILAQAMQFMDPIRRGAVHQAMRTAIELRGGDQALPGVDDIDAHARVQDHDWVFRQCYLYELGGLTRFLRRGATPDLLAGADGIDEWVRAPMGGYRLVGHEPAWITWQDLAGGQSLRVPNLGSAALVVPGECVIGRLVSSEQGPMFESTPLRVPEQLATVVASDPAGWIDALRAESDAGDEDAVATGSHQEGLIIDLPMGLWQCMVLDCDPERSTPFVPSSQAIAAATLRVARRELESPRGVRPEDFDIWPCLSAAVLHPSVLSAMLDEVTDDDVEVLHRLSLVLAEPAASVCRRAASGEALAA